MVDVVQSRQLMTQLGDRSTMFFTGVKTNAKLVHTNADRSNIPPSKSGVPTASFPMDEIRIWVDMNLTEISSSPARKKGDVRPRGLKPNAHEETRQIGGPHKPRIDARDHRPDNRICVPGEHGRVILRDEHEPAVLAVAHRRPSPIRLPHDRVTELEPSIPSRDGRINDECHHKRHSRQ
jgi:hypothetical protein